MLSSSNLIQPHMAASRLDSVGPFSSFVVETSRSRFALPHRAAYIRPNGVEFHSPGPFPVWTEMTVVLKSPGEVGPIHCTGVVVACDGNRHAGYQVSLFFLNLSKASQERLQAMAFAQLA